MNHTQRGIALGALVVGILMVGFPPWSAIVERPVPATAGPAGLSRRAVTRPAYSTEYHPVTWSAHGTGAPYFIDVRLLALQFLGLGVLTAAAILITGRTTVRPSRR